MHFKFDFIQYLVDLENTQNSDVYQKDKSNSKVGLPQTI